MEEVQLRRASPEQDAESPGQDLLAWILPAWLRALSIIQAPSWLEAEEPHTMDQ